MLLIIFAFTLLSLSSPARSAQNADAGRSHRRSLLSAVSLFKPQRAQQSLPAVAALQRWAKTELGARSIAAMPKAEQGWVSLLLSIDVESPDEARLALLSPISQIAAGDEGGERIWSALERLGQAGQAEGPDEAEQSRLFESIAADFAAVRRKAAPKVTQALERIESAFIEKKRGLGVTDSRLDEDLKELRSVLAPLDLMFAPEAESVDRIRTLALTVNAADFQRASAILEPLWDSGSSREMSATASDLLRFKRAPERTSLQPSEEWLELMARKKPRIFIPKLMEKIQVGDNEFKLVNFPNLPGGAAADDIGKLLASGNRLSEASKIAMYQQDLPEDVESILEGLKRGDRYLILGDYSEFFWDEEERKRKDGKPRSDPAQRLVDAVNSGEFGDRLQLRLLEGLERNGINHNKFRIWRMRASIASRITRLLQFGSFNYTWKSQKHHWEDALIQAEPAWVDLYESYFDWMWDIARPYRDGLPPEEPVITRPIPRDVDLIQTFYGNRIPGVTFSPAPEGQDGTLELWIKLLGLARQRARLTIFAFYPPPEFVQAALKFIERADLSILSDYGQSHNPPTLAALRKLKKAGARSRVISGPNETPWKNGQEHSRREMLHHKTLGLDLGTNEALIAIGSTNVSRNANRNSFENTSYLKGIYAAVLAEYLEALYQFGFEPDLSRFEDEDDSSR
ncbi:MAG: hypothetical protein HY549_02855 [Elusimicrobia bacterium]|nr:hypothetical protein [Elusimicrobiota bacterium]